MRSPGVVALVLLLCPFALPQAADSPRSPIPPSATAPQPQAPSAQPPEPSYANYSIMLVNPGSGTAVVLMHNPKNELEFVEVNNTNRALSAGYVPVRAAELGEFISALREENARLAVENARLEAAQGRQAASVIAPSSTPSPAELQAQQSARIAAEQAARRQQLIQSWLMLQNMNRPQTLNMNVHVTDCTRFPALCAGR